MDRSSYLKGRYLSIINGQWRGGIPSAIKTLLCVISLFYGGILWLRMLAYKDGLMGKRVLTRPVISVGNITLGGVGKTPVVEHIARYLTNRGKRVAILSRGYGGGKWQGDTHSGEQGGRATAIIYNDEYLVLRENLADVPNFLGKDRSANGRRAIDECNVDCLLLDDGFQHIRLERCLDIVVIDILNPFGYGKLFPRGFLREPVRNLRRADMFIIAHTDLCGSDEIGRLGEQLHSINEKAPVIESAHLPTRIENISDNASAQVEWLKDKKVYAFCAIGNPDSFSQCLVKHGALLVGFRAFADHYFFGREDLEQVFRDAKHSGADVIMTTQKDNVKILDVLTSDDLKRYDVPLCVVKIAIKITRGNDVLERLIDEAVGG